MSDTTLRYPGLTLDNPSHDDNGGRFDDERGTGVFSLSDIVEQPTPDDHARIVAGRYEIVERVGAGAMGQVLLVRHLRLGKEFALKLMQAEFALDPEARELFISEARLVSTLSHPNIVSVVDFGEDPDWGLFIAMELLKGDRLSELIAHGERMSVEVVCHIAHQLAAALHHSHTHNVVHGDLKTENVLRMSDPTEDGDDWHVKLLDFGTACIAYRSGERNDQISGTPAYMAPERIVGNPPAPSNDLYALGIVMYEMLTGTTPFSDGNPVALLEAHLHEQPESVAARRGEVLDDALVAIVDKSLAKAPEDRYATASELADDLRAYMGALGVRQRVLAQRAGLAPFTREESAADAFDWLDVAAAGLTVDGTVRRANPAFAKLLGARTVEQVEGENVLATPLGAIHPGIREDLRLAAMHGKLVRRRLRVCRADGTEVVLRLIMSPARGRCGSCVLVVHPLGQSATTAG